MGAGLLGWHARATSPTLQRVHCHARPHDSSVSRSHVPHLPCIPEALHASEAEKKQWHLEMKKLLWEGEIEIIIQRCRMLLDKLGEPVVRLISYYSNNIKRMRYKEFRTKNYLIGSRTVESACKQIVSMRLKRSGARWTEYGAQMTAKARTAWLSGAWKNVTAPTIAT